MKVMSELIENMDRPNASDAYFDTRQKLFDLANKKTWGKEEFRNIEFLAKRLDISKKLHIGYKKSGRKASDSLLEDAKWLEVAFVTFRRYSYQALEDGAPIELCLTRHNVFCKMQDLFTPTWFQAGEKQAIDYSEKWRRVLTTGSYDFDISVTSPTMSASDKNTGALAEIPLTVMFYEGPIARAYLATLKNMGLKPHKIIHLIPKADIVTGRELAKWLPSNLRKIYAANAFKSKIHYWINKVSKIAPSLTNEIALEVSTTFQFPQSVQNDARILHPLNTYADIVVPILIKSLRDPALIDFLGKNSDDPILFTGGGIVPRSLLNVSGIELLHIHPGYLPNIRGADCTLWSSLLTGHTSATCFYMAPGIDTGDILLPCWLPKLRLNLKEASIESQNLYRAVYGYIDPWVRAYVLREFLSQNRTFSRLDAKKQKLDDGFTFHFMHPLVKNVAVENLLSNNVRP